MWCVCCKPSAIEDHRETPKQKAAYVDRLEAPPDPSVTVRSDVGVVVADGGKVVVQGKGAIRLSVQDLERREKKNHHQHQRKSGGGETGYIYHPRLSRDVPRGMQGEQVAAGWPAWLTSVAGEAIRGWVPRRADSFEKLDKIGQGTYSNVYRARDLDNGKIVALKKVRFDNLEPESVRFMAREIYILRKLDHPNIIKLEGLVTSRLSCSLYLVFEYMEHDLAGLASFPGHKFTEPQVKCYMQQLLQGLGHCHSRNILHRDIKGSNLLIDNKGILKIADFGLASFFYPDQNQALTSRVVTLWYRPPELLLGATNYGVSVDLWSTGCILAELYAGKPIMPGRTEVEQLHKIFKLCGSPSEDYWRNSKLPHATIFKPQQPYKRCVADTFTNFPAASLTLMEVLLSIDPVDRGTAASALKSEYFTTMPYACDPSSLPRYSPSKEFDAKVREEESRRMAASGKLQRIAFERKGIIVSKAIPAPDANAELASSLQKRQCNSRSQSEKFILPNEEVASGFPIEPPRQVSRLEQNGNSRGKYSHRSSHSGPLVHRNQWAKVQKHEDESLSISAVTRISAPTGFHSVGRNKLSDDVKDRIFPHVEIAAPSDRLSECGNKSCDQSRKYDRLYQSHGHSCSYRREDDNSNDKDQSLLGYGSKGNKIHYSGPLLRPSGNVDQMLKEHDRHIQDVFRQSRLDKARVRRRHAEGNKAPIFPSRSSDISGAPIFPSSRGTPVFPSCRGAV